MKRHITCIVTGFTVVFALACATTRPEIGPERMVSLLTQSQGDDIRLLGVTRDGSAAGTRVEARARFIGADLVLDFVSPFPANSRNLLVETNLSLREAAEDGDDCSINAGSYAILQDTAQTRSAVAPASAYATPRSYGTVALAVTNHDPSAPQASARHRRRPSKRLLG